MKQRTQDPIELDFNLKTHLQSNLVQNPFHLFTQSRSFQEEGKRSRRRAEKARGRSTIRVDYGNENTVGTSSVAVSKNDPKLQSIHAFFKNLCEQELALLELKTSLARDRSRLHAGLKEFVDKQIQPNDLVTLVRSGVETDGISFTSDKELLLKASSKGA